MNGIDRTYLSTIFEADDLEEIIAEGIADICSQLNELQRAATREDATAVSDIAHRIKGVAAQLGAARVQAAAIALEEAARDQRPSFGPLVSSLGEAIDGLCEA